MKNIFAPFPEKENENILYATSKLLQLLNVKVAISSLKNVLLSHPNYLSLFSISESLQQLKLETSALSIDKEEIHDLPCPFIAYLPAGRRFITVAEVTHNIITYYDSGKGKKLINKTHFFQQWDGVVLLANATEYSDDPEYKNIRRSEKVSYIKLPLFLCFLFIAGIMRLINTGNLYFSTLIVCNYAGLIVSLLLLLYEYDQENSLIKQICSVGVRTNCAAVLNSKASRLTHLLSWSEIGFTYFSGGLLLQLLTGIHALVFLYWLNIAAFPFILLSLWYQAVIIKQWCVLCIVTQIILLTQFCSAVINHIPFHLAVSIISTSSLINFALAFVLPAFTWFFIKPLIHKARTTDFQKFQLARIKNNRDVFVSMLQKQPQVTGDLTGLGITLGNPAAQNTLITVCSPYCGPCERAHLKIETLIKSNPNWKVQIVFPARIIDNDLKYNTVSYLMAVSEESNQQGKGWMKQQVLTDWYHSSKDHAERFEELVNRYPLTTDKKRQDQVIRAMDDWCRDNAVKFTPTFFVNGHRLPDEYDISDLQYF